MSMVVLTLIVLAAGAGGWLWWSRRSAAAKPALHVPNWVKDTVYLVQVLPSPQVRTISPFALKLETWLRMVGLKYENVYTLKTGSKGQTPFIELNGTEIPDSNLIMKHLTREFDLQPEGAYSPRDLAMAHSTRIMVENHLAFIGFYWRYGRPERYQFIMNNLVDVSELHPLLLRLAGVLFPRLIRFRMYMTGIARHSYEEIDQFSFDDLRALSVQLGENPFYLGAEPSSIDCTLFGHLAQFLYIPMDFPQKAFIHRECPNLVAYVERIKAKFWPDWEAMCSMECTRGKKGLPMF
ncbi:hypothetical protein TCAL_09824 [Tigriopus californicus]|uniref:GST N-terminal domain-containing protein n=1 Tax=Tigriopus californicus TaxID=6832 RepID=A0A553PNX6_TIGCA|nr:failed axon connections-like [Tigriopus californicus]TRY79376.1 hypothetical protein TCAL_09824 [Tigriopus californicus]|eukprot:TCALIF_09824-PA protein Name:"Similar to fax Failed axon connections (Drosophila melanogaster)" AED:0.02 eAED:0.02 QI:0/-1/0/1/-1/1/1/0/293